MSQSDAELRARDILAANPFPPNPLVEIGEAGIIIKTGYSEALQRLLRWVPNAKFRPDKRFWLVPFSGADAVRAVLPEILRLAEASQDLDAAEARQRERLALGEKRSPRDHLAAAADLLYGANWPVSLAADMEMTPETLSELIDSPEKLAADSRIFVKLMRLMRSKAAALINEADELEAWYATRPEAKKN